MKLEISKNPGWYVGMALALVIIFAVVRQTPDTWGIKKYFTVV